MHKENYRTKKIGFDNYYEELYGSRWKKLKECLLLPAATVPYCEGLAAPYYLDSASILAALSLRIQDFNVDLPAEKKTAGNTKLILDACAAPGGKTLVIASRMEKNTILLSNELSAQRRRRLALVLEKHLPPQKRNYVKITGFNAAAAAKRQSELGRFAAILLDVPCSSERHVIQNSSALEKWTPARPRFLANRQWSLLSAAFLLLAPGGSLVYSTCSLNPEENDGAAAKLLKKYGCPDQSELAQYCILDRPDFSEGEETEYGRILLPDMNDGSGPLYIARFKKT